MKTRILISVLTSAMTLIVVVSCLTTVYCSKTPSLKAVQATVMENGEQITINTALPLQSGQTVWVNLDTHKVDSTYPYCMLCKIN
jgi:hypothetical protein